MARWLKVLFENVMDERDERNDWTLDQAMLESERSTTDDPRSVPRRRWHSLFAIPGEFYVDYCESGSVCIYLRRKEDRK